MLTLALLSVSLLLATFCVLCSKSIGSHIRRETRLSSEERNLSSFFLSLCLSLILFNDRLLIPHLVRLNI